MRKHLSVPTSTLREKLAERRYNERSPAFRSEAQRDRDRVLYSSAFQRLGGITQVSAPEVGHAFHTRLTHSLKVAQVARRLAERLKASHGEGSANDLADVLDVDAVEAAALAHDLGHPPFGHLAEKKLDEKARAHGGFEGNAQSFRTLTRLALRSPDQPGLNLTRHTLNATLKYPWIRDVEDRTRNAKWAAYDSDRPTLAWVREGWPDGERSLEAEIMDWADDVTYAVHDMDDFYRVGLIPLDRLCTSPEELARFKAFLEERQPSAAESLIAAADRLFRGILNVTGQYESRAEDRVNLRTLGSALITRYLNAAELISQGTSVVFEIPQAITEEVAVLKDLTWFYVIERPSLAILQRGQRRVVSELFDRYLEAVKSKELRLFPAAHAERLRQEFVTEAAKVRVVVDLLASLTEPAALEVYQRMSGITTGSLLDPAGRLA